MRMSDWSSDVCSSDLAAMASGAVDDKILIHMDAMIGTMTHKERDKPALINAKRKIRIAKGTGQTVQEVNKPLKLHLAMSNAMKTNSKTGGLKGMRVMRGQGGVGGAGNRIGRKGDGAGGAGGWH